MPASLHPLPQPQVTQPAGLPQGSRSGWSRVKATEAERSPPWVGVGGSTVGPGEICTCNLHTQPIRNSCLHPHFTGKEVAFCYTHLIQHQLQDTAVEPEQSTSQTFLAIRGTPERFWKGTLRLAQGQDRERPVLLRQGDSGAYFKLCGAVVLRVWFQAGDHLFGEAQGSRGPGEGSTSQRP